MKNITFWWLILIADVILISLGVQNPIMYVSLGWVLSGLFHAYHDHYE